MPTIPLLRILRHNATVKSESDVLPLSREECAQIVAVIEKSWCCLDDTSSPLKKLELFRSIQAIRGTEAL